MGFGSVWHWVIVALVVLVLFGRGRISEMMGDLGKGIKSFKQGMNDEPERAPAPPPAQIAPPAAAAPAPAPTSDANPQAHPAPMPVDPVSAPVTPPARDGAA